MAVFRSARRGDRAMGWRDWALGYLITWTMPLSIGLVLALFATLWRMPFEKLGMAVPLETPVSLVLFIGTFLLMVPVFSWLGLLFSLPFVWLVLRLGLGGWMVFLLGGFSMGLLGAAALGGMAPEFPVAVGILSAFGYRWLLVRRHPGIFHPTGQPDAGAA